MLVKVVAALLTELAIYHRVAKARKRNVFMSSLRKGAGKCDVERNKRTKTKINFTVC